jgi:hypothetical protein
LQYKYYLGIVNSSPIINELSRKEKKEYFQNMEDKYFKMFKEIIESFDDL